MITDDDVYANEPKDPSHNWKEHSTGNSQSWMWFCQLCGSQIMTHLDPRTDTMERRFFNGGGSCGGDDGHMSVVLPGA